MKLLQMWVEAESQVVVEGTHLTSVKDCSVYLEEGELVFCEELPDPNVSFPSTPVQGTTTPVQGAISVVTCHFCHSCCNDTSVSIYW